MRNLLQILHGHIELCRVDHALALELNPDPVYPLAREVDVELELRTGFFRTHIRDERMGVDHVDQVVARREHMPPRADVLLDSISGLEAEKYHRLLAGDRLGRIGLE